MSRILSTGGVCLSACWDTILPGKQTPPPAGQTPLASQTPPLARQAHPPARQPRPPGKETSPLARRPPTRSAWWEIRPTSGRYASYWNAILLIYHLRLWNICFLKYVPALCSENAWEKVWPYEFFMRLFIWFFFHLQFTVCICEASYIWI